MIQAFLEKIDADSNDRFDGAAGLEVEPERREV